MILDKVSRKYLKLKIRDLDDWLQIENIFLCEEYNLLKTARSHHIDILHLKIIESGRTPLIVDIGANIGLASAYFNLKYPGSRILAIEPDNGNLEIAKYNVIGDCQLISAAVSSCQGTGNLLSTGRNVGFRVCPDPSGSVIFETVESLLRKGKGCVPFIIKIDIEGFESDLFSANTDWIDLFPVMLVELHDWMLPGQQVTKNILIELSKRQRDFMHFDGYIASIAQDLSKFTVL